MKKRASAVVAWTIWCILAAIGGTGLLLGVLSRALTFDSLILALAFAAFPTVGALIVSRRPDNRIGWIFMAAGVGTALTFFSAAYVNYAQLVAGHPLPGAALIDWLANCVWPINIALGAFLLLLFPTGHLLSRRWVPVAWLIVAAVAGQSISSALMPGQFSGERTTNPFGVEAAQGILQPLNGISMAVGVLLFLLAIASAIIRFWRSRGDERQQMKWFALGAAILLACIAVSVFFLPENNNIAFAIGIGMLPLGVGIAILRYRLYDIDLIIRRTLIYGLVTALLAAIYFGLVVGAQAVIQALTGQRGQQPVIIVASTLLIAALFTPLRRRLQALVDRRFYRRKYDAARTLADFGTTLRTETDLPELKEHLVAVVRETMQPAHVSLWLRAPETRRTARAGWASNLLRADEDGP